MLLRLPIRDSFRRQADMAAANFSLAYQCFYTSWRTSDVRVRHVYWATVLAGGVCYAMARHMGLRYKNQNVSSLLHVCLHLFGNAGNLLLYDALGAKTLWGM